MAASRGCRYSLVDADCASSSLVRFEPLFDPNQKLTTAPKAALSEPSMISSRSSDAKVMGVAQTLDLIDGRRSEALKVYASSG